MLVHWIISDWTEFLDVDLTTSYWTEFLDIALITSDWTHLLDVELITSDWTDLRRNDLITLFVLVCHLLMPCSLDTGALEVNIITITVDIDK